MFVTPLNRAQRRSMREAFFNEEGAVDLASIMVGIVVIGIVAGAIAATVFAVIPWSQDKTAKSELNNVATAESAYIGFASDTTGSAYGSADELAKPVFGATKYKALFSDPNDRIVISTDKQTKDKPYFKATIKSSSGKYYSIVNNQNPDVDTDGANAQSIAAVTNFTTTATAVTAGSDASTVLKENGSVPANGIVDMTKTTTGANLSPFETLLDDDSTTIPADGSGNLGNYPAAAQSHYVSGQSTIYALRATSVTYYNGTTQVGDTFTPDKGAVLTVREGNNKSTTGSAASSVAEFKALIPTSFTAAQVSTLTSSTNLSAKIIVGGKIYILK